MGSSTWATSAQDPEQGTVTLLPVKTLDKHLVKVGDAAVYEIKLINPATPPWMWENVVVTDTIDSRLQIHGIMITQGHAAVVGQDVTVNIGDMPPGSTNTITIYVAVEDGNPGDVIENMAYVPRLGWPPLESTEATTTIGLPVHLPLIFRNYP